MGVRIIVGDARTELSRLYWDEGLSLKQIATRIGENHHTLRSRMKRAGIPLRTRGEGSRLLVRRGEWPRGKKTAAALRRVVRCRKCQWSAPYAEDRTEIACPSCGGTIDARDRRGKGNLDNLRNWRNANPERARANARRARVGYRHAALLAIGAGSIKCVRCGCDDERLIEINHKYGGGTAERKASTRKIYRDIVERLRSLDDLELCCRVCNALHYLELQFGPLPFAIQWGAP